MLKQAWKPYHILWKAGGNQGGPDWARRDTVHPNALADQLHSCTLGKRGDSTLHCRHEAIGATPFLHKNMFIGA